MNQSGFGHCLTRHPLLVAREAGAGEGASSVGADSVVAAIFSLNILRTGAGERADTVGAGRVGAAGPGILTLIHINTSYTKKENVETRLPYKVQFNVSIKPKGIKIARFVHQWTCVCLPWLEKSCNAVTMVFITGSPTDLVNTESIISTISPKK